MSARVATRAAFVALELAFVPPALHAQQSRPPAAPASPAPPGEPAAPYEPQMLRLSEILGALAFLRDLCGEKDGDNWRARMSVLLEAESTSAARKERLAGAYNRGFRALEATYRACTPNARLLMSRYLDEGGRVARDIGNRFGGG